MANFKKKPTIKEMANAIVEINKRVNEIAHVVSNLDNVLGMYIRMEGKLDTFNEYLEKAVEERKKEDDKKRDGESDKKDIQSDSKDEGSGSEGVRKEEK